MKTLKYWIILAVMGACGLLRAQAPLHVQARSLAPSEPFDNVHVQRLSGDAHVTAFVIWIRKEVKLHRHNAHSEHVYILSGKGRMRLGDQEMQVKAGDFIFIPQGTPHSVQVSKGVLKVLSVQAPEFDGKDREILEP